MDKFTSLSKNFKETGQAHHQAFQKTDGMDPEWPLWYADHLVEKLKKELNASFTKSELIYQLVSADIEQRTLAPGAYWPDFFARFFLDRYNPPE